MEIYVCMIHLSNSRFRIYALKVVIWGKLLSVHFWAKNFCSLLSIVTSQGSIVSSWNNEQIYQSTDIWLGILKWAGNRGDIGTGLIKGTSIVKYCTSLQLPKYLQKWRNGFGRLWPRIAPFQWLWEITYFNPAGPLTCSQKLCQTLDLVH